MLPGGLHSEIINAGRLLSALGQIRNSQITEIQLLTKMCNWCSEALRKKNLISSPYLAKKNFM